MEIFEQILRDGIKSVEINSVKGVETNNVKGGVGTNGVKGVRMDGVKFVKGRSVKDDETRLKNNEVKGIDFSDGEEERNAYLDYVF
ncbi:unnamed protein product [Sphenostylis stenocarpa]|uniref:Uncharacterized protein n=1 Tax=Sphenostylis stenocarpa TaxID=92480 RepID=A0AA86VSS1_9FABA|nr:unnamed protein product [Sphenostylis stenocarpa]